MIYAMGGQRCLEVPQDWQPFQSGAVDSAICNGTTAQRWQWYIGGSIENLGGGCLDAAIMANGTQLVVYHADCGTTPTTWQIK